MMELQSQWLKRRNVATGDMLGSFSGDINHSNAELKVTMANSGIATVTTIIDKNNDIGDVKWQVTVLA